ncbi:MAG: sigma-54-dependent Fis family transcriptional regulator, partial [Lentisphaerae bacterium]|nr:sigma-54-dependent Fis family transcriptional regulator [Lentisphaerota bacterium]
LESELFGHERGAFTSAVATRLGRFELAHKGTLLLDEISEMPIGVQAKLLRVLQEREFERVGGARTLKVDTRVIATTNRDLKKYVELGKFRQDLYFRLNVVPLQLPPLRERPDDIPLLAGAFLERFAGKREEDKKTHFTPEALKALQAYAWPGNIRELENLIERLAVMEEGPELGLGALPPEISRMPVSSPADAPETSSDATLSLSEIERIAIFKALKTTHGNKTKAAEILAISIRTLRNKLNEYRQNKLLPPEFV